MFYKNQINNGELYYSLFDVPLILIYINMVTMYHSFPYLIYKYLYLYQYIENYNLILHLKDHYLFLKHVYILNYDLFI